MSQFGKIDDPVDASFEAWPADSGDLGKKAGEFALTFTGLHFTPARVLKILKDQFSSSDRFARIEYLFEAFRLKLKMLESQIGDAQEQVKAVRENLESDKFSEAASVACEESVRTTSSQKIDQFSSILVGSVDPRISADSPADASSLIRDVAQLSAVDLRVLRHLEEAYGHMFPSYPNVHDLNAFTEKIQDFRDAATRSGLHPEEFQSECERLRGFGLAAEVLRNSSRMSLSEYCYRPTRRGLKLLKLLGNPVSRAESSKA